MTFPVTHDACTRNLLPAAAVKCSGNTPAHTFAIFRDSRDSIGLSTPYIRLALVSFHVKEKMERHYKRPHTKLHLVTSFYIFIVALIHILNMAISDSESK